MYAFMEKTLSMKKGTKFSNLLEENNILNKAD